MSFGNASYLALSTLVAVASIGCGEDAAGSTWQQGGDGSGNFVQGTGGSGGGSAGFGGGGQVNTVTSTGLPCDVQEIVETKCGLCHAAMPQFGAPMALATQADFQAMGADGGQVMHRAKARINDVNMPMPPPQQPALTPEELSTLNAWLDGGAQYSSEQCSTGGTGGTGGTIDNVPDERPLDADECFDLLAFDGSNAQAPFMVPTGEHYWNFTFKKPWEGNVQAVTIRHKVDNTPVVHHTLLYQSEGTLPIGVTNSLGTHGTDMLLSGWVPGGSDTVMPDDVGLELLGGDFTIEIHYFNSTGQAQPDATGMEICVTYDNRPNAAGIHWLGKEQVGFPAPTWEGLCVPDYSKGPITVLSSWPHMHVTGTHFTTVINRGGNTPETLIDGPFDFDFQATYDTPAVLNPGDTLTTTCTFSRPMAFGTSTMEEMCYNFVVAYPNGALTGGGGLTSSVNHCMQ